MGWGHKRVGGQAPQAYRGPKGRAPVPHVILLMNKPIISRVEAGPPVVGAKPPGGFAPWGGWIPHPPESDPTRGGWIPAPPETVK